MGKVVLITGGARSGKSDYAQKMAENIGGKKAFIATCPVSDKELEDRISKHRQARAGKGWHTIEETIDLEASLKKTQDYDVVLVDCLTLWVNNLMYHTKDSEGPLDEQRVYQLAVRIIEAAQGGSGTRIFVTNEVGMGIVPDSEVARKYRDLLGRCNQVFAEKADEVVFMVCGIPVNVKPRR